jgi:hypothetical protein
MSGRELFVGKRAVVGQKEVLLGFQFDLKHFPIIQTIHR